MKNRKNTETILFVIFFAVLAVIVTAYTAYTIGVHNTERSYAQKEEQSNSITADKLFDLANKEREKRGIKPLIRDARLDASARYKAAEMEELNYFEHENPTTGTHGYEYILKNMSECRRGGENILDGARGRTSQGNIKGWMDSRPHREAILDPENEYAGISVIGQKAVMHFCTVH